MRIIMPPGHVTLCLEGVNYTIDERGGFEVPDKYGPELVRVYGGVEAPSIQHIQAELERATEALGNAERTLELRKDELKRAQAALDEAKVFEAKQPRRMIPRTAVSKEGQGGNASL